MNEPVFEQLGPYRIDGVVGIGGMGAVFAATNELTNDRAAVKVLANELATDETFRERFVAEIESLKTLNHPNIVQLYGFGESDGHLYYAMELIEGTNLEQELSAGRRFTWREVTQIGIDISRALKHAHDHGVIHRDLKPGNLLIKKDEQIKLSDFGIAKLFGATKVTSNGSVLGTADYMAPEQAAGEATTPRCDLYSLGCVMYTLLAGRPPFRGKSIAEVVQRVRFEQHEPITKYANDVPRELVQILDELLAKDPDDRIRTALSLTHRLRAIQQALSISTTDKSDFSSDDHHAKKDAHAAPIVNPPPDIAERPTVCMPADTELASHPNQFANGSLLDEKRDHFTLVETERKVDSSELSTLPLVALLLLVVSLLMGGFWYTSQAPTAESLFDRINLTIDPTDAKTLLEAKPDVTRFLVEFSEDNRRDEVEEISERIALYQLKRELEVRARRRQTTGKLDAVEQNYLDALRLGDQRLEEAIATLHGLVLMHEDDEERRTRRIVEIAKSQLERWNEQLDGQSADHIEMLEKKLEQAAKLADEADPEKVRNAERIWRGIVMVYQNRPWAKPYVAEATNGLDSVKDSSTDTSSNDAADVKQAEIDEPNSPE